MANLGAETSAVQLPMIRCAREIGWKLAPQAKTLLGAFLPNWDKTTAKHQRRKRLIYTDVPKASFP